jgi:hypothetical protein
VIYYHLEEGLIHIRDNCLGFPQARIEILSLVKQE